jgi:Ca2+-binding EF-hand superfamily protein
MIRMHILAAGILAFSMVASVNAADKDDAKKDAAQKMARFLAQSPEELIKRLDKNGDGFLQKDELPPRLAENFATFDKNGDGKLDRGEVEAMLAALRQRLGGNAAADPKAGDKKTDPRKKTDDKTKTPDDAQVTRFVERLLETMDKNKDGKISKEEATGRLAEAFDRIDTNKDGFLDKEELRRLAARVVAMQGAGPGPGGRPVPRGPDFDSFDKDADGRISRAEARGTPIEALFDEMDTNKDGQISKKEFNAYYAKQAEKAAKEAEKKEAEKK